MLLTVHAATGVLIGQQTSNWWLAFIIAFASHFIMDMIPHGDQKIAERYRARTHTKQAIQFVLIDLAVCIAFSIFWLLKYSDNIYNYSAIYMGLAGALLPDFLVGIHELYPKMFKRFHKFHFKIHDIFPTKKINLPIGLLIQMGIIVFLLTLYNF